MKYLPNQFHVAFHNFDFAPVKKVCPEKLTPTAASGNAAIRKEISPVMREKNLFQRPSSPRPSPPGEGELSSVG
jgi:hypothetical protein